MVREKKERAFTQPQGGDSSAETRDIPDLLGPRDLGVVVNVFLDVGSSHVEISETPERLTFALLHLHQHFLLRFAVNWAERFLGPQEMRSAYFHSRCGGI